MANEAQMVEGPYEVHDFTVSAATQISAMTLMALTDPRTAAASSAAWPVRFAGIAATEKTAGSVQTELGLYTKGVFLLTASAGATIPVGAMVVLSGANFIQTAVATDVISGTIVGKAMEAIAGSSTGEVFVGAYS